MIENMSKREKTLAAVAAGSMVVTLLFGGFFWFLNSYNDNLTVLQGIDSRISDQENLTMQGMQAATRKRYYLETSPTSRISDARNQYIVWLTKTLRQDIGVSLPGVDPGRNLTIKSESKVVADQLSFTIRPSITLKQLVEFLNAFYSVDTLHRIKLLKLTPKTETVGRKRVRTGQLTAQIQIEVLVLRDGMKRDQFANFYQDAGIPLEKAMETIVRRDVFGPANNSPTVKVSKSSSYTSGRAISINVTANDADDEDKLSMELIESGVEGAELKPDAKGRKAKLAIPGQPAGKYEFTIRVTDNGLPSKSSEQTFQVTFKEPKKPVVKKAKPKPPPVKYAEGTSITGNLRNADGSRCVMINSRMNSKRYRLKEGESFELDGREWEVTEITRDWAKFDVEGQEVKLERGVKFAEVKLDDQ